MVFTVVNGKDFRSVHATGAFVSSAPGHNECRLVIYSDRVPVEREVAYEMMEAEEHPNRLKLGRKIGDDDHENDSEDVRSIERELQVEVALSDHTLTEIYHQIGSYLHWRTKNTIETKA